MDALVYSTKYIFGIFTASTLTAFMLCKVYNVPFFNHSQNKYEFNMHLIKIGKKTLIVLANSVIVLCVFKTGFLKNEPHTILQNITNITCYSLIAEFVYYVYHRFIHSSHYYKEVHSFHHSKVIVYPIDTFYTNSIDSGFFIASLGLPLLFINMNTFENITALYFYITAAYLAHSDGFYEHHYIHHKYIFCNYCMILPIFDLLLGTYRQ